MLVGNHTQEEKHAHNLSSSHIVSSLGMTMERSSIQRVRQTMMTVFFCRSFPSSFFGVCLSCPGY